MPLRRLLRLSGSLHLRRSLITAASHPPWAMMNRIVAADPRASSACVSLVQPPRASDLLVPTHLVKTSGLPGPDSDLEQKVCGQVGASSGDGLLLVLYSDLRVVKEGAGRLSPAAHTRRRIGQFDLTRFPDITRFVLNPVTRQLSRLPDIACIPATKLVYGANMGLLTQADRGQGPPDRFAVAAPEEGNLNLMLRYLSEKDEWENVEVSPCQLPSSREMVINQETLAFRGRLWFVDLTWGVFSADPFSDRPELSFAELPRASVLPDGAQHSKGVPSPARYRRVGVSEGRLRYVEVSRKEPFVLSSFVLDEEGSGWTLEHRVALSKLWADGGYPWLPLKEAKTPQIELLDPFNANVVYLTVDRHVVIVDMNMKGMIGPYLYTGTSDCIPCVLPPWLGSSRIPSAGKMGSQKNKTEADVLVCSDVLFKRRRSSKTDRR